MKVKCIAPVNRHIFYNTKTYKSGDTFYLMDEDDFHPELMEWIEKPKQKPGRKPQSHTSVIESKPE